MIKVTIWKVFNKTENRFEHNHIENDWVEGIFPKPLHPSFKLQEAWKNKKWKKEFCYLVNNEIIGEVV